VKQKFELGNFSGRLVDNIKQDFYAMMTVSNMLSSGLREANEKIEYLKRLSQNFSFWENDLKF
jgi:hypothetical protein